MGFPIPEDRANGEIGEYHCWVEFYLPGDGWVAIDASEASKAPENAKPPTTEAPVTGST